MEVLSILNPAKSLTVLSSTDHTDRCHHRRDHTCVQKVTGLRFEVLGLHSGSTESISELPKRVFRVNHLPLLFYHKQRHILDKKSACFRQERIRKCRCIVLPP